MPTPTHVLPPRPKPRGVLRGLLEKLLLASLGLGVVAIVLLLNLRGDFHRAVAPLGPQLSGSGMLAALLRREQSTSGEDRVLVINGQRLHISIERVDKNVADALEGSLGDCPTRHELGGPVAGERSGYGVCLHPNEAELSMPERLRNFGETRDIADLGRLEYVYGEELEGGATALLHLSSSDELNLDRLMPTEGDVMGTDPEGIPRPPDGRRALHSYEEGLPYAVTVYGRSSRTVPQLQRWYRQNVDSSLWYELDTAAEAERQGVDLDGNDALFFMDRQDPLKFVLVSFAERPRSELLAAGTMVTVAQAR